MKNTHFPKGHKFHCGTREKLIHSSSDALDVSCPDCRTKDSEAFANTLKETE